jgi:hypothetical protein
VIVQMTRTQWKMIRRCLALHVAADPTSKPLVEELLTWVSRPIGERPRIVEIECPAIGWLAIRDCLSAWVFNGTGQWRRDAPRSARAALRAVQRAANLRWHHPALSGLGAMGEECDTFLAWPLPSWSNELRPPMALPTWSPRPTKFGPPVLLAPLHDDGRTIWVSIPPISRGRIFDPEEHERLAAAYESSLPD